MATERLGAPPRRVPAPNLGALACGFVLDDLPLIVENARLHSWGRIADVWTGGYWPDRLGLTLYRPLTQTVWMALWSLGGGRPILFHAFSLVLGAAVVVLVHRLLRDCDVRPRPAFIAALLFALLPIHTEATTSAVGSAELLAAVLGLGSVLAYRRGRWLLALGLFAAAVLTKESAATLAGLAALLEWIAPPRVVLRARERGIVAVSAVSRRGRFARGARRRLPRSVLRPGRRQPDVARRHPQARPDGPLDPGALPSEVARAVHAVGGLLVQGDPPRHGSRRPPRLGRDSPRDRGSRRLRSRAGRAPSDRPVGRSVRGHRERPLPHRDHARRAPRLPSQPGSRPRRGARGVEARRIAPPSWPSPSSASSAAGAPPSGTSTGATQSTFYRRLVETSPESAKSHYFLGALLASEGDDRAAVAAYDRAIAIFPAYSEAYHNRGNALARLGKRTRRWRATASVSASTRATRAPPATSLRSNGGSASCREERSSSQAVRPAARRGSSRSSGCPALICSKEESLGVSSEPRAEAWLSRGRFRGRGKPHAAGSRSLGWPEGGLG